MMLRMVTLESTRIYRIECEAIGLKERYMCSTPGLHFKFFSFVREYSQTKQR